MSEDTIRTTLVEHWREARPEEETAIVSRWVVVAEVINGDGDMALRIEHSNNSPLWTVAGMLRGATLANEDDLVSGWEPDDDD